MHKTKVNNATTIITMGDEISDPFIISLLAYFHFLIFLQWPRVTCIIKNNRGGINTWKTFLIHEDGSGARRRMSTCEQSTNGFWSTGCVRQASASATTKEWKARSLPSRSQQRGGSQSQGRVGDTASSCWDANGHSSHQRPAASGEQGYTTLTQGRVVEGELRSQRCSQNQGEPKQRPARMDERQQYPWEFSLSTHKKIKNPTLY